MPYKTDIFTGLLKVFELVFCAELTSFDLFGRA